MKTIAEISGADVLVVLLVVTLVFIAFEWVRAHKVKVAAEVSHLEAQAQHVTDVSEATVSHLEAQASAELAKADNIAADTKQKLAALVDPAPSTPPPAAS